SLQARFNSRSWQALANERQAGEFVVLQRSPPRRTVMLCERIRKVNAHERVERQARVATMTATKRSSRKLPRAKPIPRALRERAEALLLENYAYMDSESFRQRGL